MQTDLAPEFAHTSVGDEAEAILRKCVHCGFCTATCPTYQLLGDELDGPRGRIYQIKEVFEGAPVTRETQQHLDRCLTCRACETTCPSGVDYGRLVDLGRHVVEARAPRPLSERIVRGLLVRVLPNRPLFTLLMRLGQTVRWAVPPVLRAKIPAKVVTEGWPAATHHRRMLVLEACAQPSATPNVNEAMARVLARLGITLVRVPSAGCCGAVAHHLSDAERTLVALKRNIDAWWPEIEAGAEAIVVTASGCGVMVKDYGHLLSQDEEYAAKAATIASLAKDPSEVLSAEPIETLRLREGPPIAFHAPCTLQHGQRLPGVTEGLLRRLGVELTAVADAHLCCGSAGTYSLLQPALSKQLLKNKVSCLEQGTPAIIATANVGCQLHLATGTTTPVMHWVELIDQRLIG
ncbi:MAG: glycolate oxidase iron-sulfur subunit [Gammaproteobacteria bacterium]|nr:glycolate oxidase iron-sulfur subunit [Gammaproteobacteria bacterium]